MDFPRISIGPTNRRQEASQPALQIALSCCTAISLSSLHSGMFRTRSQLQMVIRVARVDRTITICNKILCQKGPSVLGHQ